MAEITHRRSGELMRGVFRLLSAHPEGLPAKTVLEKLAELVPPTDFEKTTYPRRPDTRRYEKIVRFATIGPVKAGWLVKDKGHWGLTDAGRRAFEAFPDPERFMREASRRVAPRLDKGVDTLGKNPGKAKSHYARRQ